jgi:hypothetical protein
LTSPPTPPLVGEGARLEVLPSLQGKGVRFFDVLHVTENRYSSFRELLEQVATDLEKGKYIFSKEIDRLIEADE